MKGENKIILYQDENEITRVSVRFADEDLWLTQNQLAEIYCTTRENITMHISNIYADEELVKISTSKDFLLVRQEGNRQVQRNIAHYNLDMIIALGYRVQSKLLPASVVGLLNDCTSTSRRVLLWMMSV